MKPALALIAMLPVLAACEQRMAHAPRDNTYSEGPGGSAAQPPPSGTIAREDDLTSRSDTIPGPVSAAMLERGRERYNIFCSPCHSVAGDGDGIVVRRGFPRPPSFGEPTLLSAPDGHFYDVITNGYGVMFRYGDRIPPADRWAIVGYLRALQLSQHAAIASLSPELRQRLEAAP
ncbi:MAG TPA: cytochrome c [Bauldia sp.]|nr:cytochrome c [Bauldia sp.]